MLTVIPVSFLSAQNYFGNINLLNKKIVQYEKAEWDKQLKTFFINPYDQKDVMLDMVLTSPSGKPVVLPCYFESGHSDSSLWKARFSARETGKYKYFFRLNKSGKTQESVVAYFTVVSGAKSGFLHKNDLYTFKFDDGKLFRGIGENVAWESRSFENPKWTYDYLLPTLARNGANFFRTWMCSWNMPLEWNKVSPTKRYQNSNQYFNPGAIKRMDELVALTDSLGLYFMLTLDWHGHLTLGNNWNNSAYNIKNGGTASTPTEFFSLPASIERYKNKLRYIVARWGYSTNIAAFEFFNEIDNAAFGVKDTILIPHSVITHWHREMSRYLKEMDPYEHLVTTSVSHRDIEGMNSIAMIDFNQKHIYKHTEHIPAIYPDYIQTYGKPYVVGEFGYRWEDANPKYAVEANWDYKRGLWYGMFSTTPILPMSWWWEFFDDQNMTPYFKSVREINDAMLKAGNGSFEPFSVSTKMLHAQGMKCGTTYFLYLLNESDSAITTPVSFSTNTNRKYTVQSFNPDNREYKSVTTFSVHNKDMILPTVSLSPKKEMLFIISAQ